MAARLLLVIAYDGAPFAGWQSQVNGCGIQDELERAFARLTNEKLRLHAAGRTDAGVHALGQCAHVDLAQRDRSAEKWTNALNGLLPSTIRVMRCRYVSSSFHARFSAKAKIYRYRIWNAPVLPPLELGRAWHIRTPLDLEPMRAAARLFVGRNDFAAFSANRGHPPSITIRTLQSTRLLKTGPLIVLEFRGEGFLYKMVRFMVGSIVRCGLGQLCCKEIRAELKSGEYKGPRLVAPAQALFLVRIFYSR
jgi:tRNA pseudouridine38-40 synthase